ncbi:MAG: hypothetical protein ACMXX7_01870 [Candidatus Woesearchaeota archaeon]
MTKLKEKIINVFSSKSGNISTFEIIKKVFYNEIKEIEKLNNSKLPELLKIAKRKKAKLHRKILYHINELIKDNVLIVQGQIGKGEKLYSLNKLAINDETIKYDVAYSEIESIDSTLQNKEYVKITTNNWLRKLDALQIKSQNIQKIFSQIKKYSSHIIDVLVIDEFEKTLASSDTIYLNNLITNIEKQNFEFTLCLNIKIKELDLDKIIDLLDITNKKEGLKINFLLKKEDLKKRNKLINIILENYDLSKIIFQNDEKKSTIAVGKNGIYNLNYKDQKYIKKNHSFSQINAITINSSSLLFDFKKIKNESYTKKRKLFLEIAKYLIQSTSLQRRRSEIFFKTINNVDDNNNDFYRFASNSIIIKNIELDEENIIFLKSIKNILHEFCKIEETIFKSCGIPTTHQIKIKIPRISSKDMKPELEESIKELLDYNLLVKHNYINIKTLNDMFSKDISAISLNKKDQITLKNFIK